MEPAMYEPFANMKRYCTMMKKIEKNYKTRMGTMRYR
jgi:hypothetical protein